MSNPLRPPKEAISVPEATFPDAYFEPTAEFTERLKRGRDVSRVQRLLQELDMEPRNSIVLPRELTVDPRAQSSTKPLLGLSESGRASFRVRSGAARRLLERVWRAMPEQGGFGSREACRDKIKSTLFVSGGTETTLGRIRAAYPRLRQRIVAPVTRHEAIRAAESAGLSLDVLSDEALAPYPLVAVAGERAVTINPHSDNGFPVMGKWDTPGASDKVLGLAAAIRQELVGAARSRDGVAEWKQRAEAERAWLVTCRGKGKDDYYSLEKILAGKHRFYNVLPRQVMLNMQMATQPLEALSRHVLEGSTSAIGLSLVRGGADALISELDRRLHAEQRAYVHVGDDSWVVVRHGDKVVMFALDCSNFDLTQHRDATAEVHREVWRNLSRIDKAAADLWYEYARGRQVAVVGAMVYYFRHAGPSGMPLQSKVNDLLMEVLVSRALAMQCEWSDAEEVDKVLQSVGSGLGFTVRVEQHYVSQARSIRGALEQQPFLFVGYYFHVREGLVVPCIDVPRMLAQAPYPSQKWLKSNKDMAQTEAMRLGSMLMSAGIPTFEWEPAYNEYRAAVIEMLEEVIVSLGDCEDKRLRWAVGEQAWGPEAEASLSGLLKAVKRDPWQLWAPEPERPAIAMPTSSSWADDADQQDLVDEANKAVYIPPAGASVAASRLPRGAAPTHPLTVANHGRPPPTAVWAPDKPPRGERAPRTLASAFYGAHQQRRSMPTWQEEEEEEDWFLTDSE